ncbi:MAG: FHA domain-containing protein [Myxococcota bacterium]
MNSGSSVLKLDEFRNEARTITEGQFIARHNHPVLVVQGLVQGELLKQPLVAMDMERQETVRVKPGRSTISAPRVSAKHPGTMLLLDPVHGEVFGPDTDATFEAPSPLSKPVFVWIRHKKGRPASGPISIGRVAQCDVVVADFTVSRTHAAVVRVPGESAWDLVDLDSRNGTKLEDAWLQAETPRRLVNGATVGLGRVSFAFYTPAGFYSRLRTASGD